MEAPNAPSFPAVHRKRLKRYNVPGHAHFLTFSVYKRMPLLTNDLWREVFTQRHRGTENSRKTADLGRKFSRPLCVSVSPFPP